MDAVFLLILRDVLKGLAALHARGCVHRDLRPENIFIAVGGIGKVGDFGTTRKAGQVTERSNQTPHNQAPEDIAGNLKLAASLAKREKCKSELQTLMAEGVLTLDSAKERLAKFDRNEIQGYGLTQAADMYAFGLLCHKLLHGQDLVKGDELTVRGEALFLAYTTVKTPKDTPVNHRRRGGIEELINACKQRSEEKRPTAECLLKNEVFAEFEDERTEVSVRSMWMTLLKADLT